MWFSGCELGGFWGVEGLDTAILLSKTAKNNFGRGGSDSIIQNRRAEVRGSAPMRGETAHKWGSQIGLWMGHPSTPQHIVVIEGNVLHKVCIDRGCIMFYSFSCVWEESPSVSVWSVCSNSPVAFLLYSARLCISAMWTNPGLLTFRVPVPISYSPDLQSRFRNGLILISLCLRF